MHQQPRNFIKTLKMHKILNNFTTNNVNHSATKVQGVRPVTQAWLLKSDIPASHRANTSKGHNHYRPHQDFKLYEKDKTTHTHTCTHTHACMLARAHMHAHVCTCMHARALTHMHRHLHKYPLQKHTHLKKCRIKSFHSQFDF